MSRRINWKDDEGASLILALAFIAICGVFIVAALTNGNGATLTGERVVDRTNLQYALDAGISRAINVMQADAAAATPQYCPEVSSGQQQISDTADPSASGGFTFNGQSVGYRCQTLSGGVGGITKDDRNYAILLTAPSGTSSALRTQGAVSDPLNITGSIFFNNKQDAGPIAKKVTLHNGSVVETTPPCNDSSPNPISALQDSSIFAVDVSSGYFIDCTPQQLSDALPAEHLPSTAPATLSTVVLPGALNPYYQGYDIPTAGGTNTCTVFVPGKYTRAPTIANNHSYFFMSGYYYLDNVGNFTVPGGSDVTVGDPGTDASGAAFGASPPAPASGINGGCAGMTNATASTALGAIVGLAPLITRSGTGPVLTNGGTWVFGGATTVTIGGLFIMNPPSPTAVANEEPVNIWQVPAAGSTVPTTPPAWATDAWQTTGPNAPIVGWTGGTPGMSFYGKIYTPDGFFDMFTSKNGTVGAAGGIIAQTCQLKASQVGGVGLNLAAPPPHTHQQTPPKRVIRVTSFDASGGSAATNEALITLWNFTYKVDVHSWRTG